MPTRVIAALLLLGMAAPAAAQTGGGSGGEAIGFGIRAQGESASRGYFFFREEQPGARIELPVAVTNLTDAPRDIVFRAQDARTGGTGGLTYVKLTGGPGSWISPRSRTVTVPPRASLQTTFEMRVPADAEAGDHFGGIVAYNATDLERVREAEGNGESVQLQFIARLAIPVRVRVPGDLVARVELEDVRLNVTPSGSSVDVVFANTGNVLIPSSKGRANLSQEGVRLGTQRIALTSFLPGTTVKVSIPFEGAPAEATYRTTGFLEPMFAPVIDFDETVTFGKEQSEELEDETGAQALGGDEGSGFPVWILVLIAIVLLLVVAYLLRALRRRDAAAAPTAGPTSAPHAATAVSAGSIDLNTASVEELQALPGVGPKAAQRIVAHREEFGAFSRIDDLANVEGFDPERIAGLSGHATTS